VAAGCCCNVRAGRGFDVWKVQRSGAVVNVSRYVRMQCLVYDPSAVELVEEFRVQCTRETMTLPDDRQPTSQLEAR
jgi:hypothetical protein